MIYVRSMEYNQRMNYDFHVSLELIEHKITNVNPNFDPSVIRKFNIQLSK